MSTSTVNVRRLGNIESINIRYISERPALKSVIYDLLSKLKIAVAFKTACKLSV